MTASKKDVRELLNSRNSTLRGAIELQPHPICWTFAVSRDLSILASAEPTHLRSVRPATHPIMALNIHNLTADSKLGQLVLAVFGETPNIAVEDRIALPNTDYVVHVRRNQAYAVVKILGLSQSLRLADTQLSRLYGLTKAEMSVLQYLSDGMTVAKTADHLCRTQSTVRSHLRSLFAKTGTNRQGELTKLAHMITFGSS